MAVEQLVLSPETDKEEVIINRIIGLYKDVIVSEQPRVLQFQNYLLRAYSVALCERHRFESARRAAARKVDAQKGRKR